MKHKRKESTATIPRTNRTSPRPLDAPGPAEGPRAYPRAAELAASSAWTEWLQQSLAAILRPAAVAGALGMAACSLTQASEAPAATRGPDIAPEAPPCPVPPPGASSAPVAVAQPTPTGATLTPLGPGPQAQPPTQLPPVESPMLAGDVAPVQPSPGPAPGQTPTPPPPRPHPQTHPQPQPPLPENLPMPGGMRPVQAPPPVEPPHTAGEPPSVTPES